MKRPIHFLALIFVVPVILIFQFCMEEPQPQSHFIPEINEFVIVPPQPTSKEQVNMVTYDCKYNVLASVSTKGKEIVVKKRFNGQMKWPCILRYDTIPLGRLNQGNYMVTLLIIDTNPFVKDSVSVQETFMLKVGK